MTGEDGLFDEPEPRPLKINDMVTLLTIWGEEACRVVDMGTIKGFPMVSVRTKSGDTITVNRSSIKE